MSRRVNTKIHFDIWVTENFDRIHFDTQVCENFDKIHFDTQVSDNFNGITVLVNSAHTWEEQTASLYDLRVGPEVNWIAS